MDTNCCFVEGRLNSHTLCVYIEVSFDTRNIKLYSIFFLKGNIKIIKLIFYVNDYK